MFWDKIANVYDLFETVYNGKVYKNIGRTVADLIAPTDLVLECACGTGIISMAVAKRCQRLVATDASSRMLKVAKKKCKKFPSAEFALADIMHLKYADDAFDKVVAGNVIHLLDDPYAALKELERVCRHGGQMIIPTYVNMEKKGKTGFCVRAIDRAGAGFKRQFTYESYREFFFEAGYTNVEFQLIKGKMPCAVAIIAKK